jgi:hypothetical protein
MKEWNQIWAETFGRDWRKDVEDSFRQKRLDQAVQTCSAFRDFEHLRHDMNAYDYVPTLRPDGSSGSAQVNAAIVLVRDTLIEMGLSVYEFDLGAPLLKRDHDVRDTRAHHEYMSVLEDCTQSCAEHVAMLMEDHYVCEPIASSERAQLMKELGGQ